MHRQIKKMSLLSLKPTQRSLRKTFLLQIKNSAAFSRQNLVVFSFLLFPICSSSCFFLLTYLSFFFLFLVFLSFSSLMASFSITFERKKSKMVANRQKIINFAPRIVRNAQKRIIIIEKGWGIKATKTLNQKEDNLFVRIILMKQS